MTGKTSYRCAIYTRKSTEEGLSQDFNSLDAQRESCAAFVTSQAGLGWKLVLKRYDDGGVSGAHMERPALLAVLDDISNGKIDVVVVYKIDRLTRSLTDFSRIVEVFDAHDVSFVSVTQQFNTTTSMGRLTLNVLLSFAQFEREVTAERIRDKIAASKKKGMWMGGLPPLGFDVQHKHLIINEAEARTVRTLFDLYLKLRSVSQLKVVTDKRGLITKRRLRSDKPSGGKPFTRGHLYQLLSNPLYVGEVAHKGQTYPGQHQAIVDRNTWDAVQLQLSNNAASRSSSTNSREPSLLTGLIYDEAGDRLSPTHASKNGRRYRYYISHRLMQTARKGSDGWRIPAKELENTVVHVLNQFLGNDQQLFDLIVESDLNPGLFRLVSTRAGELCDTLASPGARDKQKLIQKIVHRITVSPGRLRIEINNPSLVALLANSAIANPDAAVELDVSFTFKKRGVEAKLVIENGDRPKARPDPKLIETIAKGCSWFEQIAYGQAQTVRNIAQRENVDEGDISRIMGFAFLAPDIVEAIVEGRQPAELTAERLKRLQKQSYVWSEQRRALGFHS
jgi:DNA invertase Pin-like site-specific DNA recombinase